MIVCPVCGSDNTTSRVVQSYVCVPFTEAEAFDETVYTCRQCSESGDFAHENDAKYEAAEKKAVAASVPVMIEKLGRPAYVQRMLGLPFGTLMSWAAGKCSPESVVLLRLLAWHPHLLESEATRVVVRREA